jgi:predicted dehydrogenase
MELRIGFIGAGTANFGGGEGPWDHASRLERIGGVRVVGVADPCRDAAAAALAKRAGPVWGGTVVYDDYRTMLREQRLDAVWIGVPPDAHGALAPGMDIERQCALAGVSMFIEKPLAAARPEQVRPLRDELKRRPVIVSVGYMFRHSRAVDAMKELVAAAAGGPTAFVGRYNCAYSEIRKEAWWDVRASGGPIVEQATHFLDLARYLVGDADLSSVSAVALPGDDPAFPLRDMPMKPDGTRYGDRVPAPFRPPRVTAAVWRFENGAVGSLTHGVMLHGRTYESELEVWGDGLRVTLCDPYGDARLRVRRPHSEDTEVLEFAGDDPYLAEDRAFLQAVRTRDASAIRSPYPDAVRTFELSWAIRDAAGALRGHAPV